MITSPHNQKLKELRRLHRRRERDRRGCFVAEGEDLIEAAELAGRVPLEGYRTPGCQIGAAAFMEVEPAALAAVSTLGSGSRAIAVYEQRYAPAPIGPLCLYLHDLADPGNIGACLRSAHAFGASCVALGPRCADPYSPKAVRASMGAIFAVSLARASSIRELPGHTVALVARAGVPLRDLKLADGPGGRELKRADGPGGRELKRGDGPGGRELKLADGPVSLLVGAERDGLPEELVAACEHVAHIPIACESLNAAMAASVALYELASASNRVRA